MSDGVDNIPGADSRCVDISVDEASVAADDSLTEIAVTQRRTPRSWIWECNFGSKESRDGVLYLCCKVGKCKWAYPSDGSTGNLSRHLENRHNINKRNVEARANNHAVGTLDSFINEGQLNWNRPFTEVTAKLWRRALVHFIVTSQLPFFLVKNKAFRELLRLTQSAHDFSIVEHVNADTRKRDVTAMYQVKKLQIQKVLQAQESLSFTVDLRTSEWGMDFLGVTVHFIDEEWNQQDVLIGFEHPENRHTGEELADIFLPVLNDFGITHLLFTITCDNGSNIV